MRLLRDNVEIRHGLSKLRPEPEDVEDTKMEWESKLADKIKQEEEETSEMITYSKELVDRQWKSGDGTVAGIWRPRGQLHVPDTMAPETTFSGYSKQIIPDSQLPPVHVKKEKKTGLAPFDTRVICAPMSPPSLSSQLSPSTSSSDIKPKMRREDGPSSAPPKSLFDRPRPVKMVPRRPMGGLQPSPFQSSHLGPGSLGGQTSSSSFQALRPMDAGPEWTIQEDWALHQAVRSVQELSLATVSSGGHSGHIVNWDLVSDMVNAVSWCYRPAKQCRARWEANLVPREEGRITMDNTPKKLKKDKKLGMKTDKKALLPGANALKTAALFKSDNNNAISSTFSSRFETIKSIANKRTPTNTPLLVNPTLRNPKHTAVLAESGVDYDSPVSPIQVALNRADRIAASKRTQLATVQPGQQLAAAAVSNAVTAGSGSVTVVGGQPQLPQSPVPAQIRTGSGSGVSASVSLPSQPAQAVVVGISQPLQQAVIQNSGTVTRPVQQTVNALSVQDLLKNVSAGSNSVNLSSAGPATQRQLASGQIIVSQAGKAVAGPGGTVQVTNQRLTPQQLALLKQQAMNKKAQEQQQLKQRLASVSNATASMATAGSSGGAATTTVAVGGTGKLTVTGAVPAIGRAGQMINRQVRTVTDAEYKTILAKQAKAGQGGVVQVSANSMTAAQLQQLGIQVATSSSTGTAGTLVKTVSAPAGVQVGAGTQGTSKAVTIAGVPGVNLPAGQLKAVPTGRGTAVKGSPQQVQQLQIQQQLKLLQQKGGLQGQRVALSTGGKGLPTQLIVPGGNKGLPTAVTVQQLQQIVKGAGLAGGQGQVIQGQQLLSHVVKQPGSQTVQARVIPVTGAGRGQTIQVVTATPQRQGAPNVTINQMGRPGGAGELTAGNNIKIQVPQGASHQQILSQISTALAGAGNGQNVSVAVRTPSGTSATVLQPAAVVQQTVATSQQQRQQPQQQQMVNLQLSVANPAPQQSPAQPQQQIQQQSVSGAATQPSKASQPQQQQSNNTDA